MSTTTTRSGTLLVAVAIAACGPAERDETAPAPAAAELEVAPVEAPAPPPVPPEVLAQLKEQYPVLREQPAPEPQPNGTADPARIPQRIQQLAPQRVIQSATGGATFYADFFEGRRTASGIPFRQNQMVAAHRSYPFGTVLRVTNLRNDRSVNVRVVDRGPFGSAENRRRTMIDLSRRAANQLGFVDAGRAQVRVEVLEWGQGVPT